MDPNTLADRLELQELANKLFMYTDAQQWEKLEKEVFTEKVWLDMQSAGGGAPGLVPAADICAGWKQGFTGLDAVHHQAGHYLIDITEGEATIFAYAIAYHYRTAAKNGTTRCFVGSYDLGAERLEHGWRLNSFRYHLKFIDGNTALQ